MVVETRHIQDAIRRQRKCLKCGTKWPTYETSEHVTRLQLMKEIRPKLIQNVKEAVIRSFDEQ